MYSIQTDFILIQFGIPSDDDIALNEVDKISGYIKRYYEIVANN